jgi:hypothetical protein
MKNECVTNAAMLTSFFDMVYYYIFHYRTNPTEPMQDKKIAEQAME